MDALKARLSQAEDDRDTLAVLVKDLSNILTQDGWKLDIKDEYAAALARAKEQP